MNDSALARFGAEYARHRAAEGRGYSGNELFSLPYLREGPHAQQWRVRARSYEAFVRHVLRPLARRLERPLTVLDLGAGNGWLSHRVALEGHRAIALDIRDDAVDGLGAADLFVRRFPDRIERLAASFDSIPLASGSVDVAVFNASIHYATDLNVTVGSAARVVRPGGRLVILDSPFYRRDRDGRTMVAEKRERASELFGDRAEALLALPFIEYLTRARLKAASAGMGLSWQRRRVLYPLWYELRPLRAALTGGRRPSRFDLWVGVRP
ncbi:MAG: class I SAM-dependent methyltransferase [Sphingomonadales bacterium]